MPAPTIQDFFGANATLSGSTLSISLGDFTAQQFDATDPNAARIAAALIRKWRSASNGKDDDPTCGLLVASPFVTLQQRGTETQRGFQYSATFYVPDSGAAEPDPDMVV